MTSENIGRGIVLITAVQDREMEGVRGKLRADLYREVHSRVDVKAVLKEIAKQLPETQGRCRLDLIGHSVEHCFLQLGDWILDESAPAYFGDSLREELAALQIVQIRLLGCSTATTKRSWTVICKIANCLGDGVEVFGTRRLIDESDYDANGFIGLDAIKGGSASVDASAHRPEPLDAIKGGSARGGSATRRPKPQDYLRLQTLALDRGTKHTCFAAMQHLSRVRRG